MIASSFGLRCSGHHGHHFRWRDACLNSYFRSLVVACFERCSSSLVFTTACYEGWGSYLLIDVADYDCSLGDNLEYLTMERSGLNEQSSFDSYALLTPL